MTSSPTGPVPPHLPPNLPLTGERTVPGVPDENYWFQRHVVAYDHAATLVSGTVLDAGCGEGYGLEILRAAGVRGVIGVEVDELTANHARVRYAGADVATIDVVEADLDDLPLVDDTLDGAVCLQVVEHLIEPVTALGEVVRVVHPGGTLVVSTPNRFTFSPDDAPPTNPFHVREFSSDELVDLLTATGAVDVRMLGVHHRPVLAERLAAHAGDDPVTGLVDPTGWSDRLRALVRGVRPDDFVVDADPERLAASLDLVAVARAPA